ncbi:hypothetical protein EYZ11_005575 [Aspergillus tanneri]|uniref:Uncharacterized protein n=1 Tax=Aspergillus tanneri TaxID=1220188 RepID=A0A4S3JHK3_9EURO|nr:hypothetical protein EYZ11_005575 [Aspergillus tanneri]
MPLTTQTEVLWHAWILAESVRRTWLVAQMLHAIYVTMQHPVADCPGGITFTVRRGAWEASSASG